MAENKAKPDDTSCYNGGLDVNGILDASSELGRRISGSDIYEDYNAALLRVKNNPELLAKIAGFKRIQMDYSRGEISLDQEKHLSKMFFDLCSNPDAAQFLETEKKMLALMIEVHENLWAGCDILLVGDETST